MAELWLHGFPVAGASAELARRAEREGYDGLLLADSQALQGDVYVGLTLAAAATTRLRVGTGVTNLVAAARAEGARSVGAYVNVGCAEGPAAARTLVRGSAAIFAHFSSQAIDGVAPEDREVVEHVGRDYDKARHGESVARHAAELPDGFLDRFAVVGDPPTVRDRLRELLALGLDRLVLVPGSKDADPALAAHGDELVAGVLDGVRR
jgi:alkanesulfonate monooxygenase SsuD/methylene tetrahydromethanopterin reductase-like flavin-dependent oxidoreductase (luciferase family)